MSDEQLNVACEAQEPGWQCRVLVGTADTAVEHEVKVSSAELSRYAAAHHEPTALVEASFRFLLEREPAHSIMRRFDLSVIEDYFPDYPNRIGDYIEPQ